MPQKSLQEALTHIRDARLEIGGASNYALRYVIRHQVSSAAIKNSDIGKKVIEEFRLLEEGMSILRSNIIELFGDLPDK